MKKLFLLLVAVLSVALCSSAQTRVVTGTVLEAGTDEPVIGASVLPGSSKQGVVTDVDGNFRVSVPANVKTLSISAVGYQDKVVNIPANNNVTVYLGTLATVMDEVVVTGYGNMKRAEYTGSAAQVNAAQLEDALTSNVTNALNGKMAGVQTLSSNGQPGTSSSVLIRGVGSINASTSPLYVVDGMPFDGDIASISNSDIESLTVLKDAASAALYGARGANGVIVITTKKGQSGQAKITVDMRWGGNSRALPNYDVITDQRQYLETVYKAQYQTAKDFYGYAPAYNPQYEDKAAWAAQYSAFNPAAHAYANENLFSSLGYQTWTIPTGQEAIGTNGKFNPYATPGYKYGNFWLLADDWAKETLINGLRQEYNISISGGTDRISYYVSGSYLSDEGLIANSHFKRFSTRANVDYQAKKWLKIGTNISYAYTNSGYPGDQDLSASTSTGNAFNLINSLAPIYPMYIRAASDHQIAWNDKFNRPIYDYGTSSNTYEGLGRTPSRNTYSSSNPAGDLQYNREDYLADILDAKWYAIINPLAGLNITGTAGYTVDNTRLHYLANSLYGQSAAYKGQAEQAQTRYRTINLQLLASYNKTFGDVHNMDLMVGAENQAYNVEGVWAIGSNLYQPGVFVVDNTIDDIRGGGNMSELVHRGFFGRAKYTYDSKYFFMGSIRRDGSSRFAPNHRWGTFWSLSAGWDIAKEKFMQDVTAVDLLKFKFSFGQNGNDGIGARYIAYADQYRIQGGDGVWSDGTLSYKGNPDITWETSNNMNFGFDFSFFRSLEGSIEYFQRQTEDMLFNIPTAPSLGYSSMPMNVGSMRNSGVEIDLNYTIIKTKDITWDVNANITFGWNKVLKIDKRLLNTNREYFNPDSEKGWLSGSRMFFEGESMYNLWLVDYAGVNPNDGQAMYWAATYNKKAIENLDASQYHVIGTTMVPKYDDEGNAVIGSDGQPVMESTDVYEYQTPDYSAAYNTNRKATGNLMPKAYGGFGTTLNAYGIDLSLSFGYQFGGKIVDSAYQTFMYPGTKASLGQNFHKDILEAWTTPGQVTDVPRLAVNSSYSAANSTSTRFLISSNYLSLNNVTLGYTFPTKWVQKLGLSSVRVYGSAENVALWSKRKGLDPRQGFTSSDNATYSPIRSIAGGIKVSF